MPMFELIDKDGKVCGTFNTATAAAVEAHRLWKGQPYDEDCVGFGWCVRVAESEIPASRASHYS